MQDTQVKLSKDGRTLFVANPYAEQGSLYVYRRDRNTGLFGSVQRVAPPQPPQETYASYSYGFAFSKKTKLLAVSAIGSANLPGAFYLFERDGKTGLYEFVQGPVMPAANTDLYFGTAMAMSAVGFVFCCHRWGWVTFT